MLSHFSLIAHRSDTNPLAEQSLQHAVQQQIDTLRGKSRYRRLAFYFFEKEITTDITRRLRAQFTQTKQLLTDQEAQALVARSALSMSSSSSEPRYAVTVLVNNYLLGQEDFAYDNQKSDTLFAEQIEHQMKLKKAPSFFHTSGWSTDMLLVLRRRRADLLLVHNLLDGIYGYRTLVQACGEYVAEFGMVPYMFTFAEKNWSSDSFLSFLEQDTQENLRILLSPQYEIGFEKITLSDCYGAIALHKTPYATAFARFGYRWSMRPWWIKISVSAIIVFISSWFGGWSLIILPLLWGLIQGATSSRQYLHVLSRMFANWYYHYGVQHKRYLDIYEQMIDPEHSPAHTVQSEKLMNDRYDITPFGGHELNWDVRTHSQNIVSFYSRLLSDSNQITDCSKEFAHICAITDWSFDHHLPLWVVTSSAQHEQSYYRLLQLVQTTKSLQLVEQSEELYVQYYDAITEVVGFKTLQFTSKSWIRGLSDGLLVAASSGIVGRLGSYLRNRNVVSSHAFAAGVSVTTGFSLDESVTHLDTYFSERLQQLLTPDEVARFTKIIVDHQSADTVRQTLKNTFGHHVGNATNTAMMDTRWRATDQFGASELFTQSFANNLPLGPSDPHWSHVLNFLDRIYGYDNFTSYQSLIHGQRLPDTLQGLHDGTITLNDFAQLSQEQREIVTQVAFTSLRKEDIAGLLLDTDSETAHIATGDIFSSSRVGSGSLTISSGYLGSGTTLSSGSSLLGTGVATIGNSGSLTLPIGSGEVLGSILTDDTVGTGSNNISGYAFTGVDLFASWHDLVTMFSDKVSMIFDTLSSTTGMSVTGVSDHFTTSGGIEVISGSSSIVPSSGVIESGSSSRLNSLNDFLSFSQSSGTIESGSSLIVPSSGVIESGSSLSSGVISELKIITPPSQLPSFTMPLLPSKRKRREMIKNHLQF